MLDSLSLESVGTRSFAPEKDQFLLFFSIEFSFEHKGSKSTLSGNLWL